MQNKLFFSGREVHIAFIVFITRRLISIKMDNGQEKKYLYKPHPITFIFPIFLRQIFDSNKVREQASKNLLRLRIVCE
jgi:hypothetical protein